MWSRFRRLPLAVRIYFGLLAVVTVLFSTAYWQLLQAEAAPCNPLACVPLPTLAAPQPTQFPTGQPKHGAFTTPTPSPRPTSSPTLGPTQLPPLGVQAPVQGQDVGVTALAQAAAGSAGGLAQQLHHQLTAPNISGDWFRPLYSRMTTIALYVLLFCLLLAAVQYIVSRRFGVVAGAWFGWAPGSIGITALGMTLTNLLLSITDAFCAYMLAGIAGDVPGFLFHLAAVLALAAGGTVLAGAMLPVAGFLAGLIIVALVGIIAELLIRQVVMYVNLLWLPLVAASATWAPARSWLYRLATLQFAVIFAKFAIVVVLALGVAAFAAEPNAMGDLGDPNLVAIVMGLIVLCVALVSPYVLLRLLPHNFEHAATGIANRLRTPARKATNRISRGVQQRFARHKAGGTAVPVASKAGAAVVPIQLVIKGGRVVAARGGRVLNQKQRAQKRDKKSA